MHDGTPATTQSIVFMVDDDEAIRSTLSRALIKRGFEVRTFETAQGFLDAYDMRDPGCLVLDYGMPGLNGLELQTYLIDHHIHIPIIFISGHGGIPETVQAMKAGAVDFLEKPFRQHVLVDCINAAFETDLNLRAQQQQTDITREKFASLTSREQEIAQFMIDNPSNTSSKEIGRALNISPRTVDHHRARILEKMGTKTVAELVATLAQMPA